MAEKLFSMHFKQDGDEIKVETVFHKKIPGRELMSSLKTGFYGMLESTVKVGEGFGMSQDQVLNYLFDNLESSEEQLKNTVQKSIADLTDGKGVSFDPKDFRRAINQ